MHEEDQVQQISLVLTVFDHQVTLNSVVDLMLVNFVLDFQNHELNSTKIFFSQI
jgi:hypothetical protein